MFADYAVEAQGEAQKLLGE